MPTISRDFHQNIRLHTGARVNVVLLTDLLFLSRTFIASSTNFSMSRMSAHLLSLCRHLPTSSYSSPLVSDHPSPHHCIPQSSTSYHNSKYVLAYHFSMRPRNNYHVINVMFSRMTEEGKCCSKTIGQRSWRRDSTVPNRENILSVITNFRAHITWRGNSSFTQFLQLHREWYSTNSVLFCFL